MSEKQQEKIVIDVNTLIQQLRALEEYIAALQSSIDRITATLNILYAGEKALEELRSGEVEALVDLDGGGVVYGKARIQGGENSKVVVHLGLDVYAEMSIDKALRVIREKQAETSKTLDAYRRELLNALNTYQQLRAVLEQAIRAAGGAGSQGTR